MPGPAIRTRLRDLAAFLEVTRRPDAKAFTRTCDQQPDAPCVPGGTREDEHRDGGHKSQGHPPSRQKLNDVHSRALAPTFPLFHFFHFSTSEPSEDGSDDFGHADVVDAALALPAAAFVLTRAPSDARDGNVLETPRSIALGTGGAKERDDRRADSSRDVQRARIAGNHQPCPV